MTIFLIIASLILIYLIERKQLARASKGTRWFSYVLLMISGGLWYLVTYSYKLTHLTSVLIKMLVPFNPIS